MQIFVTGASGFVGSAAVQTLARSGHSVVAMSRRDATDAAIGNLGGTPVRCDLENISAEHLKGCDVVIHSAAFVEAWGPRDAWYQANVVGTRNLLHAAKTAGVKRFIHIGTEAALVHGQHLDNADETYPLAPDSPYPYCATKAQAETLVRQAADEGFATIVLRPRFIWGPGDNTLLPAIRQMASNWMWVDGGEALTSTTHIKNLIHAIELALERGNSGSAYFVLDDGTRRLRDIISGLAHAHNITLGERSIPTWLAETLATLSEGVWRLFRLSGAPPLTRHAVMVMSRRCTLDDRLARTELGYQPVISVEAGLAELRALNSATG